MTSELTIEDYIYSWDGEDLYNALEDMRDDSIISPEEYYKSNYDIKLLIELIIKHKMYSEDEYLDWKNQAEEFILNNPDDF